MKITNYIILLFLFAAVISCSKNEYNFFDDAARLQFGTIPSRINYEAYALDDTMKSHTFYYTPEVKQETTYFDLYTVGMVANHDRAFKLEQVMLEGEENAIAGIHYKAFDSEEMSKYYVIPKDSVHILVPIVMLRDKSLDNKIVTLKFQLVANEEFQLGEEDKLWRKLIFTSMLNRPSEWGKMVYRFKDYSRVKHEFMIEKSGLKWDDVLLRELIAEPSTLDYWQGFFIDALIKENKSREERGLEPLEDENKKIIKFN